MVAFAELSLSQVIKVPTSILKPCKESTVADDSDWAAAAECEYLLQEIEVSQKGASLARQQTEKLQRMEQTLLPEGAAVKALEAECHELEEKSAAFGEDLEQRRDTNAVVFGQLSKIVGRLQEDLATCAAAEAEARQSCQRLNAEAGELRSVCRSLEQEDRKLRVDLQHLPAHDASKPDAGQIRRAYHAAQDAADAAELTLAKEHRLASQGEGEEAALTVCRKEAERAVREFEALQRKEAELVQGLAEARRRTELWESIRGLREDRALEMTLQQREAEADSLLLRARGMRLRLRMQEASESSERTRHTLVAAQRSLHIAKLCRRALHFSPIVASMLASAWWLAV